MQLAFASQKYMEVYGFYKKDDSRLASYRWLIIVFTVRKKNFLKFLCILQKHVQHSLYGVLVVRVCHIAARIK